MQWGKYRGEVGASLSESFISDQGTLGAQIAEMRTARSRDKTTMNDGRKNVDAELPAAR